MAYCNPKDYFHTKHYCMNRRNFIAKSSLAAIALSGFPKPRRATIAATPYTYKTTLETGKAEQWYYEIAIHHNGIISWDTATDEEKQIKLKVAYFETADFTKPSKQGEYTYKIVKSVKSDTETDVYTIETKFDKKLSGDHKFSKDFPKNMKLKGKTYSFMNILGKKDETLVNMSYPSTSSSGEDCFLTTACVHHKNLPDNCTELSTLRMLRDSFMKNDQHGNNLIGEYSIIGPQIVSAINNCSNKGEIYDHMYQHMILPSVALVQQEKYNEAMKFYEECVKTISKNLDLS